jgi:aspartyl-tRNA(Asn)/glutamyl-tRNA(Gln) amidotransferase subunit A
MCLAALGSQTGGSITRPASFCGVAGCKPTYGRVSLAGAVPLAHSMDHPGPIARDVRDLALVLQAIAGADPLDPACSTELVPDYLERLRQEESDPEPPRLGWLRGPFADLAEPSMQALMEDVRNKLARHTSVLPVALPAAFAEVLPRHRTVMAVEAASFHGERLRKHPEDYLPNIRQLVEEGLRCPAMDYAYAKEHQRQLTQEMASLVKATGFLLCPATRGPAPDTATTGDPAFNSPWSFTGLPCVSFPVGFSPEGLPLCVQLIGPPFGEASLFAAAAWCEKMLAFTPGEPKGI